MHSISRASGPSYLSLDVVQEARGAAGFAVGVQSRAGQPGHLPQQGALDLRVRQRLGLCQHQPAL